MKSFVGMLAVASASVCMFGADCENGGPAAVLLPQFAVTASVDGDGMVLIAGEEGDVEFSSDMFAEGTKVTLRAEPAVGWVFDSWSGNVIGSDPSVELDVAAATSVTANFLAVAGVRTVSVKGTLGRMTLAVKGDQARGNLRINDLGSDLTGTFKNDEFQLQSTTPGYTDAEITLTLNADGSLTGTIDGSGYDNDPMTADPVALAWTAGDDAGQRTTNIDGTNGLLTVVVDGELLRGTWRAFGSFGADVEGTIKDGSIQFTATIPGLNAATVTANVQADGKWVGTIDGSGFSNAPFDTQPRFFP
ncbi:MAG: hypothetical protein H6819_06960 [Phycisphaerales bacterium]|nr:hypothetical protein [Phycisphaerales bacterium]MCB9855321.1 hypothetical protein [Phycisphaerales bacterium]MCB9862914.1 hypothetical protein [Phycisphaerales bacterium]